MTSGCGHGSGSGESIGSVFGIGSGETKLKTRSFDCWTLFLLAISSSFARTSFGRGFILGAYILFGRCVVCVDVAAHGLDGGLPKK